MADWVRAHRWETILAGILIATIVVNVGMSPVYLGSGNIVNLFWLSNEKIVVALVMTFVIVNGEIDLSVASVMGFAAAVLATVHDAGGPIWLAILLALATGAGTGLVQGLVVARLALPSLVVTLAGLIGFRGAARVLLEDRSVGGFPRWFTELGTTPVVGPIPLGLLLFLAGLALAWFLLERSAVGRKIYVIGNNAEVARFSGVDVAGLKVRLFVVSGTVAALAGVMFTARLGSVRGSLAETFELDIITMVLLGGVSIFGGSGTILGVALAIFTVLNIRNGMGLANVDGIIQTGVVGGLLIGSVLVPNVVEKVRSHRRAPPSTQGGPGGPDREVTTASHA